MNKDKLVKGLCPLDKCDGYLKPSININRDPVHRCNKCYNWITTYDMDIQKILLNVPIDAEFDLEEEIQDLYKDFKEE